MKITYQVCRLVRHEGPEFDDPAVMVVQEVYGKSFPSMQDAIDYLSDLFENHQNWKDYTILTVYQKDPFADDESGD